MLSNEDLDDFLPSSDTDTDNSSSSSTKSSSHSKSSKMQASRRHQLQVKCPERCSICRDQSTGYHYGAATCNRCKVFFRRYVMMQKEFKCKKENKCFESNSKRQFLLCRACRYERCLSVGMTPLAIIVTGINLKKNLLVKKYEARKEALEQARQKVPIRNLISAADRVTFIVKELLNVEDHNDLVRRSVYCPRSNEDIGLEDLLARPNSFGLRHEEMPGWPLQDVYSGDDLDMPLVEYMKKRIPFPKVDFKTKPKNDKEWLFVDMVYNVDYVRTFSFFNTLKFTDKINLLKHVTVVSAFFTETYFAYKSNANCLLFPDGRAPYSKHQKHFDLADITVIPQMQRLGLDRTQYVFLKAIVTCDPTAAGLSDDGRAIVKEEQERHANALMAYLLAKHNSAEAPSIYMQCIAIISTMQCQTEKMRNLNTLFSVLKLKRRTKLGQEVMSISY